MLWVYVLSEYAKQTDNPDMQNYIEEMFGVINLKKETCA